MYGFLLDDNHILSEGQALGDGSPVATSSTNAVDFEGARNAELLVYAKTAIVIADTKYLKIALVTGISAGSLAAPVNVTNAEMLLFNLVATAERTIPAGTLLARIGLDPDFLSNFIGLIYSTDDDLSAYTVDAFVHVGV